MLHASLVAAPLDNSVRHLTEDTLPAGPRAPVWTDVLEPFWHYACRHMDAHTLVALGQVDRRLRLLALQDPLLRRSLGERGLRMPRPQAASAALSPLADWVRLRRRMDTRPAREDTLRDHVGAVCGGVLAPRGPWALTIDNRRGAYLWNLDRLNKPAAFLPGYHGYAAGRGCALRSDGRQAVTAARHKAVRLWDLAATPPVARLIQLDSEQTLAVSCGTLGPRLIATGAQRGTELLQLCADPPARLPLSGHRTSVHFATFSPDGSRALTVDSSDAALLWDLTQTPPASRVLQAPGCAAVHLGAFATQGPWLVTTSKQDGEQLWNLAGPKLSAVRLADAEEAHRFGASFSDDGTKVLTACAVQRPGIGLENYEFFVGFYDLTRPTLRQWHFCAPAQPASYGWAVRCTQLSSDGTRAIVACSRYGAWKLWNLQKQPPTRIALQGHSKTLSWATFMADGNRILTTSFDRTVRVWDFLSP